LENTWNSRFLQQFGDQNPSFFLVFCCHSLDDGLLQCLANQNETLLKKKKKKKERERGWRREEFAKKEREKKNPAACM
jgi:hypothetical protein